MWRYAVPVALFAVLAAFFYRGLYLNPGQVESPLIGQCVPEFELPNLENPAAMVSTSDLAGQMALLNVWGTWCPECYYEHDFLLQLSQSGVPIYGFNINDERDKALDWLATLGNPYVATAEDSLGDVMVDFGIYGAPETFLIAPDGRILQKHISQMTPDVWETKFVPLIQAYTETDQCAG